MHIIVLLLLINIIFSDSFNFNPSNIKKQLPIAIKHRILKGNSNEVIHNDKTPQVTNNTSNSNTNIDLFAISPRSSAPKKTISSANTNSNSALISTRGTLMELQAEKLRLEAEKEQLVIDEQRIEQDMRRLIEIDDLIVKILNNLTIEQAVMNYRPLIRKELYFRLAELANAAESLAEKQKFIEMSDALLEVVKKVDSSLHAQLESDIQKEYQVELNRLEAARKNRNVDSVKAYDDVLQQWIKQIDSAVNKENISASINPFQNLTVLPPNIFRFPPALPFNLLPVILRSAPISLIDYNTLKTEIFTYDLINVTSIEFSNYCVVVKGFKKTNNINILQEINNKLSTNYTELNDRIRVFALPDYRMVDTTNNIGNFPSPKATLENPLNSLLKPSPKGDTGIEKYTGGKYEIVYVVLSSDASPKSQGLIEYLLGGSTFVLALITTFIYSVDINSLNKDFITSLLSTNPIDNNEVISKIFIIFSGILLTQLMHEVAHFTVAKFYNIKLQFPYLLPSLQIGTFGAITRFLSFPKDRKQLFDVSIAGPMIGFIVSLVVTLLGFDITSHASSEVLSTYPYLPTGFFQISYLFNELATNYLPNFLSTASVITGPTGGTISVLPVHPYVTIGLVGLLINAFNFLPIGRLDGGRVAMALAGRQSANAISLVTLIGQAISLISNVSPETFFWLILVVFLQRGADIPPIDDITPLASDEEDSKKSFLWFGRFLALGFCSFMTGITLLPVPFDAIVTGLLPQSNNIM